MMKLAFVISQLKQHGSEKKCYELASFFKLHGHDVTVFTGVLTQQQYYHKKFKDEGIEVKFLIISRRYMERLLSLFNIPYPIKNWISNLWLRFWTLLLLKCIEKYDRIVVIGIDTYCDTIKYCNISDQKLRIHSALHPYQFERNYYEELPKHFKFVTGDDFIKKDILKNCPEIEIIDVGNFINLKRYSNNKQKTKRFDTNKKIKIGIASRLNSDRPNDQIINFIKDQSLNENFIFYWYGSGDQQYFQKKNNLNGIRNLVFKGHSEHLSKQANNDKVDFFIHVMHYNSMSYAPIELAFQEFLVLFFLMDNMDKIKHQNHINSGILLATDSNQMKILIENIHMDSYYEKLRMLQDFITNNILEIRKTESILLKEYLVNS